MKRFIIILFLGFISLNNNAQTYLPKNLDEAIDYFDNNWSKKVKTDFINDSLKNTHLTIGMWIRNNWIYNRKDEIYDGRDTTLLTYFNNLGIFNSDDMSSIIFTSLYRKLTNKPIDLNKQIEDYRKRVDDCDLKERLLALEKYNRLKIGNLVKIYLEIDTDTVRGKKIVNARGCPNVDWTYNPNKDILVNGILLEKYFKKVNTNDYVKKKLFIKDTANFYIKVKILELNQDSIPWFIGAQKVGDITDLSLKYLKIKY